MSEIAMEQLDELANALQLSIETKISRISQDGDSLKIEFDAEPRREDRKLFSFLGLVEGDWDGGSRAFIVRNAGSLKLPKIILFLLLTRMDEENIHKIAELDESAREIAEKLGVRSSGSMIDSVEKCSKAIFERMQKRKMTIKELAEATGLTQVTISNFKSGRDVKLSNLLKIARALGMNFRLR